MKREIKFRGKRLDNGEWVYGDLRDTGYNTTITNRMHYVVDPETVGQFTGLKDRSGKEIYEGDIVKWEECVADYAFVTHKAEVYYDQNSASYEPLSEWVYCVFELIGNIYDNPELLEQ